MIHSHNKMTDWLTNWTEWLVHKIDKMIDRNVWMIYRTQQHDRFIHKLDWMTSLRKWKKKTIYRAVLMIDRTGLGNENEMISRKWNDWVTHKLEIILCLQNQMNDLFVKWTDWIILNRWNDSFTSLNWIVSWVNNSPIH